MRTCKSCGCKFSEDEEGLGIGNGHGQDWYCSTHEIHALAIDSNLSEKEAERLLLFMESHTNELLKLDIDTYERKT